MYIQIYYSWGDQESPLEVPESEDPFEYAFELALDEIRVATFEAEEAYHSINADRDSSLITLYYGDGTYCYYQITEDEDFTPPENPGLTF